MTYLLLNRAQPLPRESIAFTLWPDEGEFAYWMVAQTFHAIGDTAHAAACLQQARAVYARLLETIPDDPTRQAFASEQGRLRWPRKSQE